MSCDVILVPVDTTGCSHEVAGTASDYARRLGAQVVLLSVVDLPPGLPPHATIHPLGAPEDGVDLTDYLDQDALDHLAPLTAMFQDHPCSARVAVRHGNPCDAILATSDEVGASLIIMGTHGRRGLRRLVEGSVSENVIRRAKVPVMVIRTQSEGAHPGKSAAQLQAEAELYG